MTEYTPIEPKHYRDTPPGINRECIEYIRHLPYAQGTAAKYVYRAGNKDELVQDLKKPLWYIKDALESDLIADLSIKHSGLVNTIDSQLTPRSFTFYCLVTGRLLQAKSNIDLLIETQYNSLDLPMSRI